MKYDIAENMLSILGSKDFQKQFGNKVSMTSMTKTASTKEISKSSSLEKCIQGLAKISEIFDQKGLAKSSALTILAMQTMIKEAQDGYHFGQDKLPVFPDELNPPGHPNPIDSGAVPEKEECMDCNFTGEKALKKDQNDYRGRSTSEKEKLYNENAGAPLSETDIDFVEGQEPEYNESQHQEKDLVSHEDALEDLEKLIEDLGAEEEISSDLSTEKEEEFGEEKVASSRIQSLLALAKKDIKEEKICKKCEKKISKCKCKEIAEKEKAQKEKEAQKAKVQKEADKAKAEKEKEAEKKKKELAKKKASLYEAIFPKTGSVDLKKKI